MAPRQQAHTFTMRPFERPLFVPFVIQVGEEPRGEGHPAPPVQQREAELEARGF